MKNKRTKELADLLGVTPQTIRSYVDKNLIPYHKTPTGQLVFTQEDISQILTTKNLTLPESWAYYLRSSSGKKESLQNQEKLLATTYPKPTIIIKDSASGLNENRKGLEKLITLAQNNQITDIAITTPDRLSRFGIKYLEKLFIQNNVRLHYLNNNSDKSLEQELIDDFMALLASFSGHFYKLRSKQNQQKLLQLAQKELSND